MRNVFCIYFRGEGACTCYEITKHNFACGIGICIEEDCKYKVEPKRPSPPPAPPSKKCRSCVKGFDGTNGNGYQPCGCGK